MTTATDSAAPDIDDTLLADPLAPWGALGGPDLTTPILDNWLELAAARFAAHTGDTPERAASQQLDKALATARDRARWQIADNGAVLVHGTQGDYTVTDDLCSGPRWINRGRPTSICRGTLNAKSSVCYHTITRELLRLAQALYRADAEAQPPSPTITTAITLSGPHLLALFGFAKVAEAAELILIAGDSSLALECDGGALASVPATKPADRDPAILALSAAAFADLWAVIRPHAKDTAQATITLESDHYAESHQLIVQLGPHTVTVMVARLS
jgi:hypothetical protein